jgi:hypothetical protein
VPRVQEYQCEVTQDGLKARAAPYGGDISKLPPPDGLFQPGDQYTSASGCSSGDITLTAGKGGAPSSSGTSPVVIGAIAVTVIVVAVVLLLLWRRYQRQFNPYSGSRL